MVLLLEAGGRGGVARGEPGGAGQAWLGGVSAPVHSASEPTLDDVLSESWQGLLAAASARCPVCHAEMTPRWSAGAGVVGGRCDDCASELA